MNILNKSTRIQILRCLVEGNSIRATARITGVSKTTVLKLLCDSGQACLEYQDDKLKNLECTNIQVDEIWSFIYSKKKNLRTIKNRNYGDGDSWTWTSICADTKLVPCWYVGDRSAVSANMFIEKLSKRVIGKIQLTSDGYKSYETAMKKYMKDADFGMYVKHYVKTKDGKNLKIIKNSIQGNPNMDKLSTSFVERQNLTMRMGMRRFTRKTNAFSKKIENHSHALSLYFYYYNFIRQHKTLKTTPANKIGIESEKNLESILSLIG